MKQQVEAVCAVVRVGAVHLFLERDPGIIGGRSWQAGPGGKANPGERKHDAIVREVHEELGIRLPHHIPLFGMLRHENAERVLCLWVFWCVLGDYPDLTLHAGEVRTARWATLEEAPMPLTPEAAYLVSLLRGENPTWEGAVWMPHQPSAPHIGKRPRSPGTRERSRKLSDAKLAWHNLQAAAGGEDEADRRRVWQRVKQNLTPEQVERITAHR